MLEEECTLSIDTENWKFDWKKAISISKCKLISDDV